MDSMQLVKVDYSTSDIISAILKCDSLYHSDTAKIAQTLKRSTHEQTVRAVFDFLIDNVKYKLDESGIQLARRPNRTLVEHRGDCKSYSLLAGSLLYNLGYDYSYRFASYRIDPTPTHVYVIAHTPSGNIIVDGVLKKFNQEKKPITNQIDKRMKGLYIGSIGGIRRNPRKRHSTVAINGLDGVGEIGRFSLKKTFSNVKAKASSTVKKVVSKAKTTVKKVVAKAKTTVKKVTKGIVKVVKKGFSFANKTALAVPRNAFLLLVKVNFRGFATRLATSDQDKMRQRWETLGGSYSALNKVVEGAKNKKRILGIGSTVYVPLSGICAIGEPVTVASAIASATAIIVAMKEFLPKKATDGATPEEVAKGEDLANSGENPETDNSPLETQNGRSVSPPDIETQERDIVETAATQRGNTSLKRNSPRPQDNEETSSPNSESSGMSTTVKIGLGVAAAGAVLFLAKGKRK